MPPDSHTSLARRALRHTLTEGGVLPLKPDLVQPLTEEAGVIISLYSEPKYHLRGQAGDVLPVFDRVADEIVDLAPKAALRDVRFEPITPADLDELSVVVDVVKRVTEIRDVDELEPDEEGLFIVSSHGKSAFVVPGTAGVLVGEQALNIALSKAEIDLEDERLTLYKFTVDRHSESLTA